MPFDAAFSSDLSRAHETAQLALSGRGLEIETSPKLREMAFGEWEGEHLASLFARLPGEREKWLKDPGGWQPPGGESLTTVQERMSSFLDELWANSENYERVVVFSHGFAILTYICAVIGTPLERFRQLWMHSTGITELTKLSGRIVVKRLNDHGHLEDS
jgi:probable phosphoglycerate mutase